MAGIDAVITDLHALEGLALEDSPLQRLDPRAKLLTTLLYIVCVVSFGRYELSALAPFAIFPVAMIAGGSLSLLPLLRRIVLLLPFPLMVGIFNPLIDREIMVQLGPLAISGGWISLASIFLRSLLTLGAALVLVSVTGFPAICAALERFRVPRVFVVQLLFLHRYLYVLAEEGGRMARAREFRSFGNRGMGIRPTTALLGTLLFRTWDRAGRIHHAMLCRGFRGEFPVRRTFRFGLRELLFTAGWSVLFLMLRMGNLSRIVGGLIMEVVR
ncbi:MAG: cobalt ECF transporter T component CbiQ [Geobacter sp.]|nr:cobalt ECF transporter T component CbiQ [Geobacter sp.]